MGDKPINYDEPDPVAQFLFHQKRKTSPKLKSLQSVLCQHKFLFQAIKALLGDTKTPIFAKFFRELQYFVQLEVDFIFSLKTKGHEGVGQIEVDGR